MSSLPAHAASAPSSSSAASGTQPAASAAHALNPLTFVLHINIILIALFALYVLLTLPRALARFFRPSELFNGHFLRSGQTAPADIPMRNQSTRSNRTLTRADTNKSHEHSKSQGATRNTSTRTNRSARTLVAPSEEDHTVNSHPHLISPARPSQSRPANYSVPTRVPRWTTLTHPRIVYAFNYRIASGLSIGRLAVLTVYFGVILYAGLYRSNPFTDPIRAGYVAMSQIPLVVALALKNNWLSWLTGVGYEKLNYIHRFAGRVLFLAVNVHAIGFIFKWSIAGTVHEEFMKPKFISALIALGSIDLLVLGTTAYVRERAYNLFVATHIVSLITFLIGTYIHSPTTLPYILTALGLYLCDHIIRLTKTRYTTALITAQTDLNGGSTLVQVPSLAKGWRVGQHVRLRVVAHGSGSWLGWWAAYLIGRARPFTIASAANGKGMELVIKKQGAWTRKLFTMAGGGEQARTQNEKRGKGAADFDVERAHTLTREVRVLVEGPYSGAGHTLFNSYSGALLVAGGSGISYALALLDDMLQKHAQGNSRLRIIEVVWAVGGPESLTALLPTLTALMRPRPSPHASLSLRLTVHYTRASARSVRHPVPSSLPVGLHLRAGRPDMQAALQGTIDAVLVSHTGGRLGEYPSGVVVGACGPVELTDEVTGAVGRVAWKSWRDVGGVETVEEVFGW
ncbi:hypothetical protein BV25DRAFT_1865522 [Artomyces pyxidatus]|uniref:Uncharacterized protein n=1 Tax=Artomyces pyxidatus TaxID=48021 RepID=A0ACB8SHS5_9AGAM|nr:hypothetical protein BV25DRAFT_1865522 [Artomyces pyxidatus]